MVRGFMQVEGIDFIDTFASTTIPPTWRILLALAAENDWEIEQIDFIGAFLIGDLQEDYYMEVPEKLKKLAGKYQLFSKLAAKHGYDSEGDQVIYLKRRCTG